ncbi:MAG: hypothetical protein KY455_06800 [Euryarchaeota archaeon]|nr:hypothetical protein [Euryarchaeota archaeon]
MTYRIPPKGVLERAVLTVMRRRGSVGSLGRLTELVAHEVGRKDPQARIGPERLRRLVVRMDHVRTTIHTRRGESGTLRKACPVCGASLETVRNRTLDGGAVDLQAKCTECDYWTGRERRVPVRYVFHLRDWQF